MAPRSAYIHVPFCRHRCGYCNFTVAAGRDDLIDAYLDAIERELSWLGEPQPVDTIFIGGGTPTHLSATQLARLLSVVRHWHPLDVGGEFSVEANPVDISAEKIAVLANDGVNRISLGVQSFDNRKLRTLERDHTAADVCRAIEIARRRLDNISLDLIFATPDETRDFWQADMQAALDQSPAHISTYGLTWEKGTSYWSRLQRGELTPVAEEVELSMYLEAIDTLTAAGFEHYEVSNFARPGRRCRHNERYWLGESYFAAGPGAARYVGNCRSANHRSFATYLKRVQSGESPIAESETLDAEERARERLVFGLRRLDGVSATWFAEQTGFDLMTFGGEPLARYVSQGYLEFQHGTLRLTRRGLVISDSLWPDLLVAQPSGHVHDAVVALGNSI